MASCAALPGPRLAAIAEPSSTALTAGTDIIACAIRPSSLSFQATCEPSPTGTPWAMIVTAPPSVSPWAFASSTARTISASSAGVHGAQR